MKWLRAALRLVWGVVRFPMVRIPEEVGWLGWEDPAFLRELARRPRLSDEEFYNRYYAGRDIAEEIPIRVRRWYTEEYGAEWAGVQPGDNIGEAIYNFDFGDLFEDLEAEWSITFSRDLPAWFDGSFDAVVRLVDETIREELGVRRRENW